MKKKLMYVFLWASLVACHDDEVVPRTIISVAGLEDITVAYGTEFQAIAFPGKVSVTYSDNSTEEINVTFSQGPYSNTAPDTYALEGILSLTAGTKNDQALKATVKVIVFDLRLKTTSEDGTLLYQYFYDSQNRLDHFKINANDTEYFYSYSADNKVTQRLRKLAGKDYPEKYFYHADGTLDRIEFYSSNDVLSKTHTYTYQNGKISRFDNSNQSINGLKFRTFDYDGQNNIGKVSFDLGNPWSYTYFNDKKVATPLLLDLADPQNQTIYPVATFNFVELSNYTASYTYNARNYPVEEVRTFPGDGNRQSTFTYTYE